MKRGHDREACNRENPAAMVQNVVEATTNSVVMMHKKLDHGTHDSNKNVRAWEKRVHDILGPTPEEERAAKLVKARKALAVLFIFGSNCMPHLQCRMLLCFLASRHCYLHSRTCTRVWDQAPLNRLAHGLQKTRHARRASRGVSGA